MGKKRRRQFSGEEKVAILKRHLVNHEKISDICQEMGLGPNLFIDGKKPFLRMELRPSRLPETQPPTLEIAVSPH